MNKFFLDTYQEIVRGCRRFGIPKEKDGKLRIPVEVMLDQAIKERTPDNTPCPEKLIQKPEAPVIMRATSIPISEDDYQNFLTVFTIENLIHPNSLLIAVEWEIYSINNTKHSFSKTAGNFNVFVLPEGVIHGDYAFGARCRYLIEENIWSHWSNKFYFTISPVWLKYTLSSYTENFKYTRVHDLDELIPEASPRYYVDHYYVEDYYAQ